jgi:hypothetical protein
LSSFWRWWGGRNKYSKVWESFKQRNMMDAFLGIIRELRAYGIMRVTKFPACVKLLHLTSSPIFGLLPDSSSLRCGIIIVVDQSFVRLAHLGYCLAVE